MSDVSVQEISPQEAQRRIAAGALLLDVREAAEYAEVRAESAQLLPLSTFEEHYQELPKDRELVLICRSGARSGRAAQFLLDNGYPKAVNLTGGTLAWQDAGLPLQRGEAKP